MREWWSGKVRSLLAMPHRLRFMEQDDDIVFHEDDPVSVKVSSEARRVFQEARVVNELGLKTGGDFDDDSGWGGKLMGNVTRLALTLHFLSGHGMAEEISAETMTAACAWVEPLTEHFYCACGEVGEISMDKRVHSAIKKMERCGIESGETVNAVVQHIKTRRHSKAKDWEPVWNRMTELGFIRVVNGEKPKRGPVPKLMQLHPHFYTLARS